MPTFAGTNEQLPQVIGLDPYTTENLFTTRTYFTGDGIRGTAMQDEGDEGPRTPIMPSHTPITRAGSKSTDFFEDWYFRIHIIPSYIDLGNLVSTQQRDVAVWNAYLTDKPYSGLGIEGVDGIVVTPPPGIVPPTTLNALQYLVYGVTVDIAGPPIVDTKVTYTIDGVDYTTTIVGRRVVLMPFPPNWNAGVEETILYRSTGSRSLDGTEQWMSLRDKPRRQWSYTVALTDARAQRFDNLMYGWKARLYGVPLWAERSYLAAGVSAGATVLTLPTANRTFAAGGLLVVYGSPEQNDVREIESIVGDTVTLAAAVSNDWPAGTRVYPVAVAAIDGDVSGRRRTDGVLEARISFEAEPSSNLYPFAAGANPATYQGNELFTAKVNWGEQPGFKWTNDGTRLDAGTGRFHMIPRSVYSDFTKDHNWTLRDHAEKAEFRSWAQRRKGRARPVWVPSENIDFTLIDSVLNGANRLDVKSNDYDLQAFNTNKRRDLLVRLKNGTTFARRITGATREEGGFIALQIDSGVPEAFSPSDVARISLLGFYRQASDTVVLRHLTDEVAVVTVPMVTTKE